VAVAADLSKYLDKAYEDKTLEEVLAAPIRFDALRHAIRGG